MLHIDVADENLDDDDNARKENAEDENAADHIAGMMLQIDMILWFRKGIRHLRENDPAQSPSNYGCQERSIRTILLLLGEKRV